MRFITAVLILFLLSCTPEKEQVDLLVYNARIYTVDAEFTMASAFAVRGGRFVSVGDEKELRKSYTTDSSVDAAGKVVIPGLIDAHCHFYKLGLKQQELDLTGTQGFGEVLGRVRQFQDRYEHSFIIGKGWDQNDWEDKEFPDKQALDELYPDVPVVLERIDGHAYLVNQKALDLAGIHEGLEVAGGEILKKNGRLSGILIDNPMGLVQAIIPDNSVSTNIRALKEAERIAIDNGLTTVDDAGLDREIIALIDSLQQVGELDIRVYAMVSNNPENLAYFLENGPLKTDRLNVRSIKVYADGALGSRGAVLKKPYTDLPGHFGAMVTPVDSISNLAKRIATTEFQLNTHAIGDSANAVVLHIYKSVLQDQTGRRWRIEHAQTIAQEDFNNFGPQVIPSVQPTHATSDMYWAEERLGNKRIHGAYSYKTLLQQSGMIALGTDFPVEDVNPFNTFYAAVTRRDLQGYPEGGYLPDEKLSREEALRGMTIWAAYSNFEDAEKGSIEAGKWADFVILSDDLLEVPVQKIPHITAEQGYIGGKKVK